MRDTLIASVLHLSRQDCQALRLSDPYSLHRVVYSLFPDVRSDAGKLASEASGIQFADLGGDVRGRKVLLLSDRAPAANVDGRHGEVNSRPLPAGFLDHQMYRFRIVINPTRRDNVSKKLLPVKGREAIADWFMTRAETSWGFIADPAALQVERVEVLRFKEKAQRDVTLAQAHITGVLRVADADTFRQSVARGIGRGRAFGCGLLQIVPITE
ncbi:type I-E CRISPR-associated protein Cas6/Cse3/CasE [Laribacter hongkongensis]|uniref:type I-E CRISPR-associated protein Cas6/Cse3/CasE n=1 Tax=Laribacter hongkongensis TaxID=168471 RepID=UPI001EFD7C31|nr:type I-E CRISPR-associated protein Cas6/Cse3/CasE [Laribacter hongkongensis]MCG9063933.1 type I-E CRISPR-associated protein Cas6/Cse3/CasE [Laribacter hongkongensis]